MVDTPKSPEETARALGFDYRSKKPIAEAGDYLRPRSVLESDSLDRMIDDMMSDSDRKSERNGLAYTGIARADIAGWRIVRRSEEGKER